MKQMKWLMIAGLVGVSAVALNGCGTISKNVASDGSGAEKLVFPDPGDALVKGGTFPNIADLRQIGPGMTREQLYQMLGRPHFHEGFHAREWDYLFNFRTGDGNNYVTCEFKVLFNKDRIAESFYWKPKHCADLIQPKPVAKAPPPPPPAPLPAKPIRLSTDTLFAFDKSELTPKGEQALDQLLGKIESASKIENIHVVGYTDRIGTDAYNMKLSKKRADSVRDYLVDHGVPADTISTEGRGEADPVVTSCHDASAGKLIACLAPNRRVEISGTAKE